MPVRTNYRSAEVDPLISAKEAAGFMSISLPTFWRRVADGTLKKPIKIGSLSRWPLSEIQSAIDTAKDAR